MLKTMRYPNIRNIEENNYISYFPNTFKKISFPLTPTVNIKDTKRCHAQLLKLISLKVDFMYKTRKNEHFNGKNICPT